MIKIALDDNQSPTNIALRSASTKQHVGAELTDSVASIERENASYDYVLWVPS
jgi:hypothetical protein